MSEKFIYKNTFEQVIEYVHNSYPYIDYRNLAFNLLKNADEKEIEGIFRHINNALQLPEVVFELKKTIKNLAHDNGEGRLYYVLDTKVEERFNKDLKAIENSLNTGDQIVFLCGEYAKAKHKSEALEFPLYNLLMRIIGSIIANKVYVLRNAIESQSKIDISNAFHLFLLYEKKAATAKFLKVIKQDKASRRNNGSVMHYWVMMDTLLNRLGKGVEFIPKITVTGENGMVLFTTLENSISRKELDIIINEEDHFNRKTPLVDFNADKLINPSKDITDYNRVEGWFSTIFHEEIIKLKGKEYWDKIGLDLGKIFLNTITDPYPSFLDYDLIRTREYTIELLQAENSDFKNRFFRLIYDLKEEGITKRWNTKFPLIFNHYIKTDGYSVATIRRFFRRDTENPIFHVENELK